MYSPSPEYHTHAKDKARILYRLLSWLSRLFLPRKQESPTHSPAACEAGLSLIRPAQFANPFDHGRCTHSRPGLAPPVTARDAFRRRRRDSSRILRPSPRARLQQAAQGAAHYPRGDVYATGLRASRGYLVHERLCHRQSAGGRDDSRNVPEGGRFPVPQAGAGLRTI